MYRLDIHPTESVSGRIGSHLY